MGVEPIYTAYEAVVEPIQRNPQTGLGRFELPKCRSQSPVPYRLATAHYFRTPVTIQSELIALSLMEKKRREMRDCASEDTQKKADFHYKPNQFEDS